MKTATALGAIRKKTSYYNGGRKIQSLFRNVQLPVLCADEKTYQVLSDVGRKKIRPKLAEKTASLGQAVNG